MAACGFEKSRTASFAHEPLATTAPTLVTNTNTRTIAQACMLDGDGDACLAFA
jgi:hypothetical protein